MSVTEYRDRFLQLARYAPADVADDGKKQEYFMEGLEDYLQYTLLNLSFDDFNHLVDSALNMERKYLEMEDKKRKITPVASGSNTRPRLQPPQQYQRLQSSRRHHGPGLLSTLTRLVTKTRQEGVRASEYFFRRRTTPTDELSRPPGKHPNAPVGNATPIGHIKG